MHRELEFSSEAEQALASLIGTLRSGNEADLTTRLLKCDRQAGVRQKALCRSKVAQDIWDRCDLGKLPDWLQLVEKAKMGKWGTFSRRPSFFTDAGKDDSLRKQVAAYFQPRRPCTLCTRAVDYADQYVSSLYGWRQRGKLRPLDLEDAATRFHNTGLGFPVVSSNSARYLEQVLEISRQIWESNGDPSWVAALPALAGYRGQPLGPPHPDTNPGGFSKTRFIYMMPRALANLEKCIQAPLFDALKSRPEFCAWAEVMPGQPFGHAVDVQMSRLLSRGKRILSVDFKRFDQSVPFEVIDRIYAIYRNWFVPEAAELIDFCQEVFKHSGIIIPDGDGDGGAYEFLPGSARTGGVPSGSVLTNMNDSNVNAWVMAYAAKVLHCEIDLAYFQGDDAASSFHGNLDMADLSGVLFEHLGMTLSVEKSGYEHGMVTFLQNVHHSEWLVDGLNRGVRPIMHAANAMVSHERADDSQWRSDDYETIRWCQQVGYSLHHPSATQMCDWTFDNDVYAKEIILRATKDPEFFRKACEAVRRKDCNSQKGFSPNALLSSPVFQYMLERASS